MPTKTQTDAVLKLTLNSGTGSPVDFACQLTSASFTQPGPGSIESVKVACGGDPVVVAGAETTPGAITGEVFKDFTAAGLSTLLAKAVEAATTTGHGRPDLRVHGERGHRPRGVVDREGERGPV